MLNDYKEKQQVLYNIAKNEIMNDYISHAYLIDENNNKESFDIVMAFVKEILCSKLDKVQSDILCKRIDDGNYPEIKIIEPDGLLIKKQQILDLQQAFSKLAIEGNKRIYVIRDADKMRSETANSMLKFLEEPDNDIIAILMTNNYNNLLPTIISRCQVIKLNNDGVGNDNYEYDELVINFIDTLEKEKINTIIKEQELLFNAVGNKERDKITIVFDKMIDMYYDILKICNGCKTIINSKYYDVLSNIANMNNSNILLKKIQCLIDMKDRIKNNVNINLLIDSLIIDIGGVQ